MVIRWVRLPVGKHSVKRSTRPPRNTLRDYALTHPELQSAIDTWGIRMSKERIIFCDFDGTITVNDNIVAIMKHFNPEGWEGIVETNCDWANLHSSRRW